MRKTLIVFAFAILCSSFAGAQTTKSVCDGEQGAAYGLCNAFCDAMDCDGDSPEASETACNKVRSKFEQITGHQPPCLKPPVSCVCNEGLSGFLAVASAPVLSCTSNGTYVGVQTEAGYVEAQDNYAGIGLCVVVPGGSSYITPAQGAECMAFLSSLCP